MILLSGPCVIESRDSLMSIAKKLEKINNLEHIDFYFKASFDKANRTSLSSFRGPGLEAGLKLLEEVKKEFGFKLITDIHESSQAQELAKVVDIIQIPAFLCRQTDLLVSSAKTKAIINIKKGQFMNPKDMKHSVLKVLKTRDEKIETASYEVAKKHGVWLTERGSSFGYGNLVVDMRGLKIMKEFAPIIFDATHSVQMPGSLDGKSGGDSSFVPLLARAAFASTRLDGLFAECHFDPKNALSDGPNMLRIDDLYKLVSQLEAINNLNLDN